MLNNLMQRPCSVGPPNKIQQRALPFLLRGADIIAQAPPTQERIAAYVISYSDRRGECRRSFTSPRALCYHDLNDG